MQRTPEKLNDPEPNHRVSWQNLREGVYRFVWSRLRNRSDAEDAAQEVLLRFMAHPDLDAIRDPASYLLGIAQYVVFGVYAQRKRDSRNASLDVAKDQRDPRAEPHEHVERAQIMARLAEAMAILPIKQRDLLFWRMKGLSMEDAARAMGLSLWMAEKERAKAYAELTFQLGSADSRAKESRTRERATAGAPVDQRRGSASSTTDSEVPSESAF